MIMKIQLDRFKTTDEMELNRRYFILEGITGIGMFSLTTGNFLAGFISFLGGSETLNGRVGVVHVAMGVFQLLAALILATGTMSRKNKTLIIAIVLRILMSSVYFVPFVLMKFGAGSDLMITSFVICFAITYAINAIISPIISSWMIDTTPMRIRGRYLAFRERISLAIIAVATIVFGRVLDYNKAIGDEFRGFLLLGVFLIILGVLNVYAVYKAKNIETEETKKSQFSYLKRIIAPIKDPVYQKIILLYIIWNFALFVGITFVSVFMVEKLHLSYTYMMSMNVVTVVVRVFLTQFWGSIADKKSWFAAGGLSVTVLAITHMSWAFVTTDNTLIMIPLLHVMGGIGWAGAGISLFNIQYMFAKQNIRTMSVSVNAAIGGIVSIIAVSVSGSIVEKIGDQGINLFGLHHFGNMQTVFLLSGILLLLCPIFILKVLRGYAHHITD